MPTVLRARRKSRTLALSAFRRAKLDTALQVLHPGLAVAASEFWHFVELDREPGAAERALLDRLVRDGDPVGETPRDAALYLVTPRFGTISPWSSKATDSARNCGLAFVRRIERGIAHHVTGSVSCSIFLQRFGPCNRDVLLH